jgi:hypothetical protein
LVISITKLLKSTPPNRSPNGGVIISSTKDLMTLVKAVPIINPTAKSNTLPCKANLFEIKINYSNKNKRD